MYMNRDRNVSAITEQKQSQAMVDENIRVTLFFRK